MHKDITNNTHHLIDFYFVQVPIHMAQYSFFIQQTKILQVQIK